MLRFLDENELHATIATMTRTSQKNQRFKTKAGCSVKYIDEEYRRLTSCYPLNEAANGAADTCYCRADTYAPTREQYIDVSSDNDTFLLRLLFDISNTIIDGRIEDDAMMITFAFSYLTRHL